MISETIRFLGQLAEKLDGWAEQSRTGGWSTHQIAPNREAANDCRRMASKLARHQAGEDVNA